MIFGILRNFQLILFLSYFLKQWCFIRIMNWKFCILYLFWKIHFVFKFIMGVRTNKQFHIIYIPLYIFIFFRCIKLSQYRLLSSSNSLFSKESFIYNLVNFKSFKLHIARQVYESFPAQTRCIIHWTFTFFQYLRAIRCRFVYMHSTFLY